MDQGKLSGLEAEEPMWWSEEDIPLEVTRYKSRLNKYTPLSVFCSIIV